RLLKSRLPPFMVPSALVTLQELPLTPNGKIDRGGLPSVDGARPELERAYVPPETPVQEALASIWEQVLGVDRVGVDDDFFDLGGHSMLAVMMLARVRDALGLELRLAQVFDGPTIRELSGEVVGGLLDDVSESDLDSLLAELEPER